MRKLKWTLLGLIVAAALLLLVAPALGPFERLNCKVGYYDAAGGRVRSEQYLLGWRIDTRAGESELTYKHLKRLGELPEPQWHPLFTRTPWKMDEQTTGARLRRSADQILRCYHYASFTDEAEEAMLRRFRELSVAASGDPANDASQYAQALFALACEHKGQRIEADMLPRWPTTRAAPDAGGGRP